MSELLTTRTGAPQLSRPHRTGRLRIAVVAESLAPDHELTGHVLRTLAHLRRRGHDTVLLCPRPAPECLAGAPVVTVTTIRFRGAWVGLPSPVVTRTLASFAPDVVHLAGPFLLGAAALTAALQLGVPSVAVAGAPGGRSGRGWSRRVLAAADLTLVSSDLELPGIPRSARWSDEPDGAAAPAEARLTGQRLGDELIGHYRAVIAARGRSAGTA